MDVTALPGVIAARGGTQTHNKPELSEIVAAMKDIKEERDPMTVNVCGALVTLPKLLTKSINKMFELDEIRNAVGLDKTCNAGKAMEDMDLVTIGQPNLWNSTLLLLAMLTR
jgi:hypothetical protein